MDSLLEPRLRALGPSAESVVSARARSLTSHRVEFFEIEGLDSAAAVAGPPALSKAHKDLIKRRLSMADASTPRFHAAHRHMQKDLHVAETGGRRAVS